MYIIGVGTYRAAYLIIPEIPPGYILEIRLSKLKLPHLPSDTTFVLLCTSLLSFNSLNHKLEDFDTY